ncbi:Threonine/homoserine efflux transporter RhtA [Microlunatus soli]|uniref:Threonine/homoserine efflux transporter RhtA n=1 Tax=Microlunatus soli TaxID=630515 RepID=A0A1H1U7B5_9ACTN|nr:Threonine/homoserine efflux transporter RhtA [Microlunatus soli]
MVPDRSTPTSAPASAGLAMISTMLLWASAFVVIRWVAPYLSPGPLALVRLAFGTATLSVLFVVRRRRVPTGRSLVLAVAYGVAWFAGYTVLLNWAEHHLDAGTAAMLVNVAPILIALLAGLFLGEGLPRPLFLGMGIALGGVVLIGFATGGGDNDLLGLVLGLASALLYTAGMLIQKIVLRSVDALALTWTGCTAGLLATLPFVGQTVQQIATAPISATIGAAFLGVGPTAIGFSLWAYAQTRIPTGQLAAGSLIIPAIALVMSAIVLHELPPVAAIIGGALCLTGVAISRVRRSPRIRPTPPDLR